MIYFFLPYYSRPFREYLDVFGSFVSWLLVAANPASLAFLGASPLFSSILLQVTAKRVAGVRGSNGLENGEVQCFKWFN